MEKKTIGKFISALRRASGMTQKELGERLFVSDKTVSRWECDECTPELSLIPAIAEIFGITTDELLRGERTPVSDTEDHAARRQAKSEKQFRLMLHQTNRKYKNCTLISVGISIFGLIAAMIADLGFYRGWIAFFLVAAFCVISEICQICFARNAYILPDEEDNAYTEKIEHANTAVTQTAIRISFLNLLIFAFCLPLIVLVEYSYYGLHFEEWLVCGMLIALSFFVVGYIVYTFCICKELCRRGLLVLSERQKNTLAVKRKLLLKTVFISIPITLALVVSLVIWDEIGYHITRKEYTFHSCEDFKAFMENDYDQWYKEGYSYVDENGEVVVHVPIGSDYPNKVYQKIYNTRHEVVCEYYYNPNLYHSIIFENASPDQMPVTVIPLQTNVLSIAIETVLSVLLAIDLAAIPLIYGMKLRKIKKKYAEA